MKLNVKNRTIFSRDNLEVMRGMTSESVDLIYLDPPFNSNHDYAAPIGSEAAGIEFKDTWSLSDIDEEWVGMIADEHVGLYKVINAAAETGGGECQIISDLHEHPHLGDAPNPEKDGLAVSSLRPHHESLPEMRTGLYIRR